MEVMTLAASRDSSSGPDATDIAVMLLALQELHSVDVTLTMCVDGAFASGGLLLIAAAVLKNPLSGGHLPSVSRSHRFPNRDSKTLEGALYKLLHELDNDCCSMWMQQTFRPDA